MASRLSLPKAPWAEITVDPGRWVEAGRRGLAWRPPRGAALHRALYRGALSPYWFGSDVPAPQLPLRDTPAPAAGAAGDQVVRLLDEIGRRIWILRALTILARSAWLGVLIACIWLAIEVQGGPAHDLTVLLVIAGVIAIPGVIFAGLSRPTRPQIARMLDRSFGLQERMSTAVGNLGVSVPNEGDRAAVVYLQVADAANIVAEVRRNPAFAVRPPVRELVLAIAVSLLLVALYFLRGVGGGIPAVEAGAVPSFTPAVERMAQQPNASSPVGASANAPTTAEVQERAQRSNEARQDLDKLAQALADHAVTSSAASAMERGDYAAAADDLRQLAEDADKLSPASRQDLAQDLDNAASQMSQGSQSLSDAARQAADGLRQGDTAAQEGVRDLGDEVERTGSEVASQQELAEQMRQAQAAQSSENSSGQSSQNEGDPSDQLSGGSDGQQGSEQSGDQPGSQGQTGEGSDAQPGDGSQGSESGQNQGDVPQGDGRGAANQQSQGGDQSGDPNAAQPGAAGGQPTDGNPQGQQGQPSNSENGSGSQSAAGAGSGPDDGSTTTGAAQSGADGQQQSGETPPEQNVTNADGGDGQGQATEGGTDPRGSIVLARAPSGESVQTSSDNGGSNVGSGPGVSVTTGTSTQGEVGESGPDSNRVPPSYRQVVEDYFSDLDGSTP